MTTTKTIFEKTYMVASQAEKAAAKEFGDNWASSYVVVKADKRFAVQAKPLETPAALVESVPVARKGAQALVARACETLASLEKMAHDVVENLTLAQALAESGETIEELKEEAPKPKYVAGTGHAGCGYQLCPHCGIDLDNGVTNWDHTYEIHGAKTREVQQQEWACLACGGEWGPKRAGISIQKDRAEQNGVTRPSEGGVCAKIWAECDVRSGNGLVPPAKDMKAWALEQNVDQTTCMIQYYQWRKFMGVVGRAKEMPAK